MTRRIKFCLAELGTERDFEEMGMDNILEKLNTEQRLKFGPKGKGKKNRGFTELKFYPESKVLIGNYCRETTQPTRSILVSTIEGIKRIRIGEVGEETSLIKRSFVIIWLDIKMCAFVEMPSDEADFLAKEMATTLFRYAPGQGYWLYTISDEAMAKLKEMGSAHEEEIELRGVLRLGVKSIGKSSLAKHIDRLHYIREDGKSSQIENERDRFTMVGINLDIKVDDIEEESDMKISSARQCRLVTQFTLEGDLPSDEEFDDMETTKNLGEDIRQYVQFFLDNKIIRSELIRHLSLTKYRVRTFDDFEQDIHTQKN